MIDEVIALSYSYYERNNYFRALEVFKDINLNIDNIEHHQALLLLAKLYCHCDKDEKGIQILKELLKRFPFDQNIFDSAIEVFSGYVHLAVDAENMAKEMIRKNPDNDYYYYILSYVGFHWLCRDRVEVLNSLNRALALSNFSEYLDFGYEVYGKYGLEKEKNNCLELLLKRDPLSYKARFCLLKELLDKKDYKQFLESALDMVKEYPDDGWIIDNINDVKDILYGDLFDKIIQKASRPLLVVAERSDSLVLSFILVQIFPVLIYLICLVLMPFYLVHVLIVQDFKHVKLFQSDDLYRRIVVVSEYVKFFESSVLFSLEKNSHNHTKFHITNSEISLASKLVGNVNYLSEGDVVNALEDKKTINIEDIKNIVLSDHSLELNEKNGSFEEFETSSPDVLSEIEAGLLTLGWKKSKCVLQSYCQIFLYGLCLILLGLYMLNLGLVKEWNIIITLYLSLAIIVNGLHYLIFRLNNRLTIKYFEPDLT
ncbi:MAG TPA: hypothetical protein PKA63_06055 [Oligoflexia bacterium]|nr:hypothetical protein [Oligoflexia bacterium]HMP48213.1 hypothetical protein [Oligoflexia bacterium]